MTMRINSGWWRNISPEQLKEFKLPINEEEDSSSKEEFNSPEQINFGLTKNWVLMSNGVKTVINIPQTDVISSPEMAVSPAKSIL